MAYEESFFSRCVSSVAFCYYVLWHWQVWLSSSNLTKFLLYLSNIINKIQYFWIFMVNYQSKNLAEAEARFFYMVWTIYISRFLPHLINFLNTSPCLEGEFFLVGLSPQILLSKSKGVSCIFYSFPKRFLNSKKKFPFRGPMGILWRHNGIVPPNFQDLRGQIWVLNWS